MQKAILLRIALPLLFIFSCSRDIPGEINVKKDFAYVYAVIEKCFGIMVAHIQNGNKDQGLDKIEALVKSEEKELENVGIRLNSIILSAEESMEIVNFNQKYDALHSKWVDYLEANLNPEQKDRFVTAVADGIANRFMSQLKAPDSSWDFFKKVLR